MCVCVCVYTAYVCMLVSYVGHIHTYRTPARIKPTRTHALLHTYIHTYVHVWLRMLLHGTAAATVKALEGKYPVSAQCAPRRPQKGGGRKEKGGIKKSCSDNRQT
ncbi:hypothetical protein BX600DRAFT_476388 [Xylariales sp. PMI_506]|nr:hypothetical protein BX600DRAFT_476388 [Xylariales sp. PMI_506]